ncbi:hypothetical protein ACJMK2_019716 [Sinanodonta woodiana]|uniref:Uncharacterized protein n=1 Tax=Sinanodonta woodiana TaxID=1069815 RepID=A0ABD3TWR2_SINWO
MEKQYQYDSYQKNKEGSKNAATHELEEGERTGNTTLNSGTEETEPIEMVKTTITIATDDSHETNKARIRCNNEKEKQAVITNPTLITQEEKKTTITPEIENLYNHNIR